MVHSVSIPPDRLFVGVDIAATTATVAWLSAHQSVTTPLTIVQTPHGFAQLQQHLQATATLHPRSVWSWKPPARSGCRWLSP